MKYLFGFLMLFIGLVNLADAQIAAGGNYSLEQTVVGTGGGTSAGGSFSIVGTNGQTIAGTTGTAPNLSVKGGFWTAQPLVPTAASVSLGGRVTTADGSGIRNIYVTLTQADGTSRTALTASFGYFGFDEIEVGQTVIISVRAKRFGFAQPTLILSVTDNAADLNFVALPMK